MRYKIKDKNSIFYIFCVICTKPNSGLIYEPGVGRAFWYIESIVCGYGYRYCLWGIFFMGNWIFWLIFSGKWLMCVVIIQFIWWRFNLKMKINLWKSNIWAKPNLDKFETIKFCLRNTLKRKQSLPEFNFNINSYNKAFW